MRHDRHPLALADPQLVEPGGLRGGQLVEPRGRSGPSSGAAGWSGSSTHGQAIAVDEPGPIEVVPDGQRDLHEATIGVVLTITGPPSLVHTAGTLPPPPPKVKS